MALPIFKMFEVFQKGRSVLQPGFWKNVQNATTVLGGLIITLVQIAGGMGHALPIDENTATLIAGGIVAVVNVVLTLITSKHVGLPNPVAATESNVTSDSQEPQSVPATEVVQPVSKPVAVEAKGTVGNTESVEDRNRRIFGDY